MSIPQNDPLQENRVFVGGISWKATEVGLNEFFSTFGKVVECKIIMDKNTGKSKGYGFVTFSDPRDAQKVKQSSKLSYMGKMMNVGDAVRKNDFSKGQIDYQYPVIYSPYEYNYNQYNFVPQYFANPFVQFVPPMFYGNGFVPPFVPEQQAVWYPPIQGAQSSMPDLQEAAEIEVGSQKEQMIQ